MKFIQLLSLLLFATTVHAQNQPRLVLPIGHAYAIKSVALSADEKYLLTTGEDNTSILYNVSSGKQLNIFSNGPFESFLVHSGPSSFGQNDKLIVTIGQDGAARIWDCESGLLKRMINESGSDISYACFSPNGEFLLTTSSDNISRLYDVNSGNLLQKLSNRVPFSGRELIARLGFRDPILSPSIFSPNGKRIITIGEPGYVNVWDAQNGKKVRVIEKDLRRKKSVEISPDGSMILISFFGRFKPRIYDIESGNELLATNKIDETNCSAKFSHDGRLFLTAVDSSIKVWDISTGNLVAENNKIHYVDDVYFISNNELLIKGRKSDFSREGYTWNIQTQSLTIVLKAPVLDASGFYSDIIVSKTGKLFLSSGKVIQCFDLKTGKLFNKYIEEAKNTRRLVYTPKFHSFSQIIGNKLIVWDENKGLPTSLIKVDSTEVINNAVFNSNGEKVFLYGYEMSMSPFIYDFKAENKIAFGPPLEISSAQFNLLDSKLNAIKLNSYDRSIDLFNWDIKDNYSFEKLNIKNFDFTNLSDFSPNSKYVLINNIASTKIYLIDLETKKTIKTFLKWSLFYESISALKFSKDSKFFLVVKEPRWWAGKMRKIIIYGVNSGKIIKKIKGHNNFTKSLAISPDGAKIVSTAWDGTAIVWDLTTGTPLNKFISQTGVFSEAIFSYDGKKVITTGDDHKTILWDVASGKALYTRLQLKGDDWLVYDEHYRFDGTPGAIEKLYFVCGLEPIDLAQMKDSLWVPGLAEKIMTGQEILVNDKPAPKLSELNICNLTPVIEPIEQEDKRILKYRIIPRNGELGNTEVYINGNLTYSLSPKQLKKTKEDGKEVYYLTMSTDSLQVYLTGKKNFENPIVVKSKVKGSGIYGRGVVLELEKTDDEEEPQFYGVFVGVNDYGNPQKTANETRYRNLDYAAKDANDLSLAVEKTAANLFKSDAHIYRLTGTGTEAPTKENLQRVLFEIGEKSKASDILYIFFAGHGDIKKGKNEDGKEQDQIRFMLMNADKINPFSTSFGVEELTKWCSPQKIKAQKRVFVFDACHSGKIIDQTMAFNGRGDEEGARIRQLDKLKDKNGMMILAAAADDESAYEDETLNQGVLTYHLLQVMKEQSDTSLIVRNWFDETIELVKDYSKANGNKQEPSSFGDGRFEIGNVNAKVREVISISCPKQRVGACEISAGSDEAETLFPNLEEKVHRYFSLSQSRGNLVYSEKSDKAYRALGSFNADGNKISVRYKIKLGNEQIGQTITLPQRKYNNEDELVQAIVTSITQEIEALSKHDEHCKLRKK